MLPHPSQLKFGKRESRPDPRLPKMAALRQHLTPAPPNANWLADSPGNWGVMGNDEVGNCVVCAASHTIMQQSWYVTPGRGLVGTTEEAITTYSAIGGYVPGDASTDQGLYVLGHQGLIEHWYYKGIMCGGVLNKLKAVISINHLSPEEWKQGISIFGAVLLGLRLPLNVVSGVAVPFVWSDPSGPIAGGHEVVAMAYETVGSETLYDIISWGVTFRCTEQFLLGCLDEAVVPYTHSSITAQNVNAAGVNEATLLAEMKALRAMS